MPPKHIEGLQNKKGFLGKINPLALGEQHTESRCTQEGPGVPFKPLRQDKPSSHS